MKQSYENACMEDLELLNIHGCINPCLPEAFFVTRLPKGVVTTPP